MVCCINTSALEASRLSSYRLGDSGYERNCLILICVKPGAESQRESFPWTNWIFQNKLHQDAELDRARAADPGSHRAPDSGSHWAADPPYSSRQFLFWILLKLFSCSCSSSQEMSVLHHRALCSICMYTALMPRNVLERWSEERGKEVNSHYRVDWSEPTEATVPLMGFKASHWCMFCVLGVAAGTWRGLKVRICRRFARPWFSLWAPCFLLSFSGRDSGGLALCALRERSSIASFVWSVCTAAYWGHSGRCY